MAEVNSKRVLVGALAGGVAWIVWSMIVNIAVLGSSYAAAQQTGALLTEPRYGFFMPVWILTLFVLAYVVVWIYAGVRATFGAGPRTALTVGLILGFAMSFPLNFSAATWAPMSRVFPLWWMIEFWVGAVLAAFIGGWLYRED